MVIGPHFIGSVIGSKRMIRSVTPRVLGPTVTSPGTVDRVRAVLRGIIDRKLKGGTKSGRFRMSKGANATRISRKGTKCAGNAHHCLMDFYKCFPSRTPGCDYVMTVRGPKLPTSNNLVTNDIFDGVTRHMFTGRLTRSLGRTGSSASVLVPSIGGKSVDTTRCMLGQVGMGSSRISRRSARNGPM